VLSPMPYRMVKPSYTLYCLVINLEDFDENLFQASLADDHITKPFKSEDLVQNVMDLLNSCSPNGADKETSDIIELSSTHRVDEDVVIELGKNQLMDAHADLASKEEEEIELDLPNNLPLTGLDEKETAEQDGFAAEVVGAEILSDQHQEEGPSVDIAATGDDQAEMELADHKESLDELLMKVDELSRKSEEIPDNGQELSRMKAIDEMLNEVNALKGESIFVATKNENKTRDTTESRLSPDPTENDSVLAEVDYSSEENAEVLETNFDEITNEKKYPAIAMEPSEHQASISQVDAFATKPGSPVSTFKEESILSLHEENPFPSKEKIMDTGEIEENIEKPEASQFPQEAQLNQLMEAEVKRLLQESLTPLIEKEISGLSEKIMRAVEENVREITPGIAKAIIEKEIDKIKTMEDC